MIWFRMAVPRRFHAVAGCERIQETLATTDRRKASILAARRRAQLFEEWEAACSTAGAHIWREPTDDELDRAAVLIANDLVLEEGDRDRRSLGPHLLPYLADQAVAQLEEQRRYAATGDHSLVHKFADEVLDALRYNVPRDGERYAQLCDKLNAVYLSALTQNVSRNQGDLEAEPQSSLVKRVRADEAEPLASVETVTDVFELYATERLAEKSKRPAGIDQDRMVVTLFSDFVGRSRAVGSLRFDDAKSFVDLLPRLPKNYKKRRDYRGLTVRESVEKGEHDGAERLSVITQQRYISTLSPFFDWLKSDKGGRRVTANFFAHLHKDTSKLKRANRRPSFTADQIATIVGSPLYTGFRADGLEHVAGNERTDDWRFWIPIICLFSGARIGEIAQLQVDDIYREHGIWCADLREDEATAQKTKGRKSRTVPLHSTLIGLGIIAFVDRQAVRADGDGNRQLFPELRAGKRGQFGDKPSDWWRDYLSAIGVKNGRDGFGAHSFRHTMADQLRAAGHLDAIFGPLILGHGSYGTTAGYGEMAQGTLELASKMIESVTFIPIHRGRVVEGGEPVDFSHLTQGNRSQPEVV